MSRFDTMASISSRLSLGTTTSSDCAGVTTPPTVWIASCCTTPSTGAVKLLQPGPLLGLDQVLREPARLLLGLGEFVGQRVPIFGHRLAARLADRRHRRLRFVQMALLDAEFLLLFDQQLKHLEIGELRAQLPFHQRLADIDALLDDRNHRLELVDGGRDRGLLGFLLRLLARERGDLGAVLGHLVEQSWRWALTSAGSAPAGGVKSAATDRRLAASAARSRAMLSCSASRSLCRWSRSAALTVGSSSISTSPALTAWPSCTRMARTTPVSNGWMTLVRPLGTILPVAEATMSIVPHQAQTSAAQNSSDDRDRDRAADRRRRRLHDLERRRQERQLLAAPVARAPERNDGFASA